jgi:hypothetical protein
MKLGDRRRVTASRAAVRSRFGVRAISQDLQYNTAAPHRRTSQTLLRSLLLSFCLEDIRDRIPHQYNYDNFVPIKQNEPTWGGIVRSRTRALAVVSRRYK